MPGFRVQSPVCFQMSPSRLSLAGSSVAVGLLALVKSTVRLVAIIHNHVLVGCLKLS